MCLRRCFFYNGREPHITYWNEILLCISMSRCYNIDYAKEKFTRVEELFLVDILTPLLIIDKAFLSRYYLKNLHRLHIHFMLFSDSLQLFHAINKFCGMSKRGLLINIAGSRILYLYEYNKCQTS